MLEIQFTPQFQKDSKRLSKKHYNLDLLKEVIDLVAEDTDESRSILRQRHNMHMLKGNWSGSNECHVY